MKRSLRGSLYEAAIKEKTTDSNGENIYTEPPLFSSSSSSWKSVLGNLTWQ